MVAVSFQFKQTFTWSQNRHNIYSNLYCSDTNYLGIGPRAVAVEP
jgi:hypothetical protein